MDSQMRPSLHCVWKRWRAQESAREAPKPARKARKRASGEQSRKRLPRRKHETVRRGLVPAPRNTRSRNAGSLAQRGGATPPSSNRGWTREPALRAALVRGRHAERSAHLRFRSVDCTAPTAPLGALARAGAVRRGWLPRSTRRWRVPRRRICRRVRGGFRSGFSVLRQVC